MRSYRKEAVLIVDAAPEAMVRFRQSATPLNWRRLYREGGAQALKPKPKGSRRIGAAAAPTHEEELVSACA